MSKMRSNSSVAMSSRKPLGQTPAWLTAGTSAAPSGAPTWSTSAWIGAASRQVRRPGEPPSPRRRAAAGSQVGVWRVGQAQHRSRLQGPGDPAPVMPQAPVMTTRLPAGRAVVHGGGFVGESGVEDDRAGRRRSGLIDSQQGTGAGRGRWRSTRPWPVVAGSAPMMVSGSRWAVHTEPGRKDRPASNSTIQAELQRGGHGHGADDVGSTWRKQGCAAARRPSRVAGAHRGCWRCPGVWPARPRA